MAVAMACAIVVVAIAQVRSTASIAVLTRTHQNNIRAMTQWGMNVARVYSNEFLRIAVRSRIPELDEQLATLQERHGVDRAEAVRIYLRELEHGQDEDKIHPD